MTAADEDRTEKLDAAAQRASMPEQRTLDPGERLGRYRIERLIGLGGMGSVYLATQTEPVKREVALKLCRDRRLAPEDLSRFLVERQVLARMNHPAIAQLLDGGTLEDGSPYFVMEYVPGGRIMAFAQERALPLAQRIDLFCDVCHGIEHAHRRGVIHCDLKPSNLLVVEVEGRLQAKVIDFGIARAMAGDERGACYAGTPGYMSPEQASGTADLDTRTDVFSLGVLLFELVTGQPFARGLEAEPSTLARQLAAFAAPAERLPLRQLGVPGLSGTRCAELDAIIARATAVKREDRFGSAQQLAEALARWQAGEAVPEYSTGQGYRLYALMRRHALLTAVSAMAFVVVGVLGVQLLVQYQAVRQQRDVAQATVGLLMDTFQAADPYTFPGASMSVRELLSRSAQRTLNRALEPTTKLRLLEALGEVQANLELWEDAHRTRSEARRIAESAALPPAERARHMVEWIRSLVDLERWEEALGAIDRVVGESGLPPDDPRVLQAELIRVEVWEYTDQRASARALLDSLRPRIEAVQDPQLRFEWLRYVGRDAVGRQDGKAAIGPLDEAYRLAVDLWGEDDARTGVVLSDLALAEALAGELDRAERHRRSLVALSEELFGGDSVGLAVDLSNLGSFLQRRGDAARLEEAVAVFRRALAIFEQRLGEASADTATAANGLASALEARGQHDEARTVYQRAESMMRAARGSTHSLVGIVQHNWGRNELSAGRSAEAERLLESAGGILAATLGRDHPRFAVWQHTLSRLRLQQGRLDEAEALIRPALAALVEAYGAGSDEARAAQATAALIAEQAVTPAHD